MCSKWAPRHCGHIWIRRAKFLMTLLHSSFGIALVAVVIAAFRSGIVWGLLPYTLSLRYPHIWKSGGSSPVNAATAAGHTCGWSVSQRNVAVAMPMIRGGWHQRTLTTPLHRPSAVQNLPITWTYCSVLIVTDHSLSPSNQIGPMMPCLEMATQAVHFTECNGLCRRCSGGVSTPEDVVLRVHVTWQQKMCLVWNPDIVKKVWHSCVDRLLLKICLNYKYLLFSSPWHLEGQIW